MRPRLASEKAFEERQSIDAFDPYFQMHAQLLNVFGPLKRMLVQLTFLAACSSARFCCSSPARDCFLQAKGARRLSKACTDSAQGAHFLHCGMHECSFFCIAAWHAKRQTFNNLGGNGPSLRTYRKRILSVIDNDNQTRFALLTAIAKGNR